MSGLCGTVQRVIGGVLCLVVDKESTIAKYVDRLAVM